MRIRSYAALITLSLAACAETDAPTVNYEEVDLAPETLSLDSPNKADGARDYSARRVRGGLLVDAYADLALTLNAALVDSGIFRSNTHRGVTYTSGRYIVCAQAGDRAACRLFTQAIDPSDDTLGLHGYRFRSASSELFGALASIEGVNPRRAREVATEGITCGKNRRAVWCDVTPTVAGPTLEFTLENLGDLGDDYVYETWLITDDGPISAGRFPMNDANESFSVELDADLAAAAQMYVLTIEPAVGDDPTPAATHVVAGAFDEDGMAELSIDHPAAFNNDFTAAMGEYFLQTPTSPDVADDYNQGLWFVIPGVGPSLLLPELPAGWVYEGWVVDENGPVSTGRFVDPAAPDSDGAGPAAGPGGAPPFPGQDFVDPARDLIGNTIVITVEPEPDNSPGPFFFKPLVDMNAEDLGAGVFQSLANQANTAPRGVAVINR